MFTRKNRTIPEKLLMCGLIALHINLVLPLSDVLPMPEAAKKALMPEARADEPLPSWRAIELHEGGSPSIAIDNSGAPHIAFGKDTGDDNLPTHIFYGHKENGLWNIGEITPAVLKPRACAETSIAIDRGGKAHIVYALEWGHRVSYVSNKSGDWQETIVRGPWTGNYESFFMDEEGGLHFVYWNNNTWTPPPYPRQLNYVYNNGDDGAAWNAVEGLGSLSVKRYADFYCPTALAVTRGDFAPHVIAGDESGGLLHCYKSNGIWLSEKFGSGYEIIYDANGTLRADSNNNLYCVVQNASGVKSLYLAKKTNGQWSYELITRLTAGTAAKASLAIDAAGEAHIAYFDGRNICYGKKSPDGGWSFQEAAAIIGENMPADISLALNNSGWPRIVYSTTSDTSKKIYYAEWDVHPPNEPPVIDEISDKAVNENELLEFSITALDDPEDSLTYSLEPVAGKNYPEGAALNNKTGVFEWAPTYKQAGCYEVNAKVSDDKGGESLALIKITVSDINTVPVVEIIPDSFCASSGADFKLRAYASDEDEDTLTYEVKENGTIIKSGIIQHGESIPDIARTKSVIGIYEYTITAIDPGSESGSDFCSVEVVDPDEDPDNSFPISGDFNGDGMTDVGAFNTITGSWKIAISDEGRFNSLREWMSDFKGKDADHTHSLTGDFNGDGRADICSYDTDGGDWRFAFSDGTAFTHDAAWDLTGFGGGACSPLIGDFNGDGITDIGYADGMPDNDGSFCVRMAKKDRAGFVDTAIPYDNGLPGSATYAGDFNGDGLTDILAFDRSAGKWNVRLSQDTTSTQCVNLIEDHEYTSIAQSGGKSNSEGRQRDGDFWTAYDGYSWVSQYATDVALKSVFTFQAPARLKRIVFKQGGMGGGNKEVRKQGRVIVYYNSGQSEVISTAIDSVCSLDGDWLNVTKIEMSMYIYADGGNSGDYGGDSPADAHAYQHEFQAWGFAEPAMADGSLPAFTKSVEWLSGFGEGMHAVITDYNHDGKTDIGYFDSGAGEWQYALSNGTGFDSMIRTTTGNINHGSHADTCDGDWDTWAGFYDGGSYGSKSSKTTTLFEWPDTCVAMVKYKCFSSSGIGGSGSHQNSWNVYLKINGVWDLIDSGSGESGVKTKSEGWANCGGIRVETNASADSNRECSVATKNYEVQAFEALSEGVLSNKALGVNWPSPFGEGGNILPSGGDYSGDGIGDAAVFDRSAEGVLNKWKIKLHNSEQPDLLIGVDNGIGGTTNIEYEVSTQLDNTGADGLPGLPFPVQVVKREIKSDGISRSGSRASSLTGLSPAIGNSYSVDYEYSGGMFEPDSREFRGFKHVKIIDSEGTIKETEFYQGDVLKGRPAREEVRDSSGKIYSAVTYEWQEVNKVHGGASDYPYLLSQTTTLYNHADGTSRDTKTVYSAPDVYGNVGRIDELGFVDEPLDDRFTLVEYDYNPELLNKHILGKPKHTVIMQGAVKAAETWYRYDALGSLKEEEKYLDTKPSGENNPVTKFKYDYETPGMPACGNLVEVEDALGRKTLTTYEASYEYAFPVKVTNALGHAQSFTYDKKTGQILTSIDPNGQTSRTIYDTFGRTLKIIGPNDTEASPGIEYIYDLSANPSKITTITKVDEAETAVSYAFMDGLGRAIETKTPSEDADKQLLSGIVKYDSRGQVIEKYLPYFVTASSDYVPPDYAQLKITYVYDPVGRVVETMRPDGASSFVRYEGWRVTAIDENNHKATSEKDAFGRLIKVTEYNGSEEYLTQYQYDTLGNLTKTIDAEGNETVITYDSLGRKRSMDDPDMGHWTYDYDALGNLKKQTDAKGQVIEFQYDSINRLTGKLANGQTIVTYAYDTATPQNPYAKGRLAKVTDSSGMTEFFYDNLGREVKTVKTINGSGGLNLRYEVLRTYDSIDRLKTITYPDGEAVTYTYNKAGGIETVKSSAKTYVTNVDYNVAGQMTRVDYGNGTHTTYDYDDKTSRLKNLTTNDAGGTAIQNLGYAFDNVGNVKSITDASFNGTNTQTFEYDALSRLTKAVGASYGTIDYKYDSIGNMLQNGNITMEYGQNGAGPHAVTSYDNGSRRLNVCYDPNGNMLSKETSQGAKQFTPLEISQRDTPFLTGFTYDIENRLTEVRSPKEEYLSNYEIPLKSGWNFISLPVIVTEDISAILAYSGITKAQVSRYNPETQVWENFAYEKNKDLTKYNSFTTFDYGRGYEIYVDQACVINIAGATPSSERTLDLKTGPSGTGWNLIAAPTTTSIAAKDALKGVTYDGIYEVNSGAYTTAATLEAGKSYFLKVSTNQTWNIPREQEVTTYAYDGDGGRVKVTAPDETATYIGSLYETSLRVSGATEASSIKKHIFLGSTRICTVENTPDISSGGFNIHYYYYHQDHIGSSNVITDETGKVVQLIEYSPYGLTSREEGAYNTNYRFTGKLFDTSTALYYYGARYYDPELGRFIQPDTIVPYPDDPQSFNRYSYCRNNPITYIDPTGHAFWDTFKKWIGNIVGAIAGVFVTAISGGNVWLGLQTYGFWSGVINSAISGDWGAMAGGMAGSIVGGALGIGAAKGIYSAFGESAFSFGAGFLGGAAEFGLTGFGAGFGSTLGGGGSFQDAMKAGLVAGGVSAVAGGLIQGSYLAGWQNVLHGTDRNTVGKFAGVERKISLEVVRTPLPGILNEAVGGGDPGEHWGIRIKDNYNEFNGVWDFDYIHNRWNDARVGFTSVPGMAQAAPNKTWTYYNVESRDLQYISKVYGNIQQNLGRHYYNLKSYTCQTWVNNRMALRNDNFVRP